MSTKIKAPVEVDRLLREMDISILQSLSDISRDEKKFQALRFILDLCVRLDSKKIVENAGRFNSMDTMIDVASTQMFNKGRISLAVLLNALLANSPSYLERQLEGKGKTKHGK